MPQSFAFFDLDHTLLPFDTQALFCNFVLKRERGRTLKHLLFFPVALGRALEAFCSEVVPLAVPIFLPSRSARPFTVPFFTRNFCPVRK